MIRPFRVSDTEQVSRISDSSLKEDYDTALFYSIYESWNGLFLVAVEDNMVVGFINGLTEANGLSRILMLAVHNDYRYMGIGSALLDNFVSVLSSRGARKVLLEVRPSNLNAIGFYRKKGFRTAGMIRNFYNDGEDGIRMVRDVTRDKVCR